MLVSAVERLARARDERGLGTAFVERAVHRLPKTPRLVAFVPRRLPDIFENRQTIASELGAPEAATDVLTAARTRIEYAPLRCLPAPASAAKPAERAF